MTGQWKDPAGPSTVNHDDYCSTVGEGGQLGATVGWRILAPKTRRRERQHPVLTVL